MRLFVAVDISNEIKDYIYALQKKMQTGLAKIKWVHKKNLHITLKFLGDVKEDKIDEIKKRLETVKFDPFTITLTKFGYFPSENNIKVIWIGLDPKKELVKLQQKVDGELLDLFHDEQVFQSHLTLGRVKSIKKKKEYKEILDSIGIEPLACEVNSFTLMKSELKRGGSEYEELARF